MRRSYCLAPAAAQDNIREALVLPASSQPSETRQSKVQLSSVDVRLQTSSLMLKGPMIVTN